MELWVSLGLGVLSVIATILVTRHFYKRSIDKALSPYILLASAPLEGIDPEVRTELEIRYQQHAIDNLYELRFLIANTGEKPIRDVIDPLEIDFSPEARLLDASILFISPVGRKISLVADKTNGHVEFFFDLLNKDEFFIVKFLLNAKPDLAALKFSITADDLPPSIAPKRIGPDQIGTSTRPTNKIIYSMLPVGAVFIATALAVLQMILFSWDFVPNLDFTSVTSFFRGISSIHFAAIISGLVAFLLFLFGVLIILASLNDGSFPPRKARFLIPEEQETVLRKSPYFHYGALPDADDVAKEK